MVQRRKTPRTSALRSRTGRLKASGKSLPANSSRIKSSREKVRAHRKRMRAKGFRLVQMWLPDTRSPEFAKQARREALAIANSPTEEQDQAFIDSMTASEKAMRR